MTGYSVLSRRRNGWIEVSRKVYHRWVEFMLGRI